MQRYLLKTERITEMIDMLKALIGEDKVATGERIGADFCHDEYPGESFLPEAVVTPTDTEEVSAVLKACAENSIPVTVRGAGTGQAGGCVPIKGGIVLSLKGMDKILDLDEENKTLHVQAGVLLQDVKAAADGHGLYYPPDPGEQTATIGGNVATNASGPCAVKYGKTRDYISEAVVVMSDGSIKSLGDSEALSVFVGSEGTLGVITELTLKLVDKPRADAILLFPVADVKVAADVAKTIMDAGFDPAVVELMDTELVEFSGTVTGNPVFPVEINGERVGATLMVTLEGEDDDGVMEKMEAVAEATENLECLDILVGDTVSMKREFWAAHSAFHISMESGAKSTRELNIDVPFNAIVEMIHFVKSLGEENELKVLLHSHIGSGGMHVYVASELSKDEFAPIFKGFASVVYAKCRELGGSISGEYGVGYAKSEYLSVEEKERFAVAKAELDPNGILNPGKAVILC